VSPTIVLQGEGNGVIIATQADTQLRFFTGRYQRWLIPVVGHNLPQEAPKETAAVSRLIWPATGDQRRAQGDGEPNDDGNLSPPGHPFPALPVPLRSSARGTWVITGSAAPA
jgi:hypothetical protein